MKESTGIRKLTIQEAVEILLMSQSSVYSWVDKGKLKVEDSPTGKLVVVSEKEIENIRELNMKSRRNKVSKQVNNQEEPLQENPEIEAEYQVNYEENLTNYSNNVYKDQMAALSENLVMHITKLASDAGKMHLLEDLSRAKEEDAKHWKDSYFEILQERNALQQEQNVLNQAIGLSKLEVEALNRQVAELKRQLAKAKSPVAVIKRAFLGR